MPRRVRVESEAKLQPIDSSPQRDRNAHSESCFLHVDENGAVQKTCGRRMSSADSAPSSYETSARTPLVVTVRLARCRMPYRWRDPLPPFVSILSTKYALRDACVVPSEGESAEGSTSTNQTIGSTISVLTRALNSDEVRDDSWLSSAFIDLVLSCFARAHLDCHFMPIEFAAFRLKTMNISDMMQATDILGRVIDYDRPSPVIFLAHVGQVHWNLLRVQHWPVKELQLFEPLGKPEVRSAKKPHASDLGSYGDWEYDGSTSTKRKTCSSTSQFAGRSHGGGGGTRGGVSMRYIPLHIIHWLDTCWPLTPAPFVHDCVKHSSLADNGDEDDDGDEEYSRKGRGKKPRRHPSFFPRGSSSSSSSESSLHGSSVRDFSSSMECSWLRHSVSAVTSQHQFTGFDCGVACLLYAEKCAQGMMREDINAGTTQSEITRFRQEMQLRLEEVTTEERRRNDEGN